MNSKKLEEAAEKNFQKLKKYKEETRIARMKEFLKSKILERKQKISILENDIKKAKVEYQAFLQKIENGEYDTDEMYEIIFGING
jgi:hypothetical protein